MKEGRKEGRKDRRKARETTFLGNRNKKSSRIYYKEHSKDLTLNKVTLSFFFFGCTCSMWKFRGQGSNPCQILNPQATRELPKTLLTSSFFYVFIWVTLALGREGWEESVSILKFGLFKRHLEECNPLQVLEGSHQQTTSTRSHLHNHRNKEVCRRCSLTKSWLVTAGPQHVFLNSVWGSSGPAEVFL